MIYKLVKLPVSKLSAQMPTSEIACNKLAMRLPPGNLTKRETNDRYETDPNILRLSIYDIEHDTCNLFLFPNFIMFK